MDNLKDEQNDEVEFNNFDKVFVYDLISHYFLIGAKGEKEIKEIKENIMILDIMRYILNSYEVINIYKKNKI